MTDELMEIFTECIEAIEEGRLTVADCLNQYVQYRFELEQLLLVAEEMRSLPTAKPDPVFREEAPMRLRAKMMVGKPGVNGSSPAGARSPAAAGAVALAQRLLTIPQSLVQMWHVGSRSMWAAGLSVLMFTFLLAGLLFSSSGFSSAAKSRNEMLPVEDRPVTVEVLEGSVEIMAADGKWVPVSKLATVANGQRVRTGDFSSARLTFSDGSSSNIGPNSEVTIQSNFNNNFAPGVGPTPTMTVTATTTPTPTMGVTPTPTPTMTATVTTTPTPTMGVTPTPTPTMSVTPTPRPTIGITPTPTPTVGNTPTPTPGQEMVTICHKPGTPAEKTMTLPVPALNGHMVHGDIMGPCQDISPTPPEPSPTAGGPTPTPGDPTPTPVEPTPTPGGGGMVLVCHKPGTPAQQTMTIPEAALPAHLAHGDTLGACE